MDRPNKINFSLDLRIVCVVLLAAILAMLALWRPWETSEGSSRTIEVVGEHSFEAEPDEYAFYPTYQERGADRAAIQQRLKDRVNEVISKLKELGVAEDKIQLASSTYEDFFRDENGEFSSNSLTVKVANKELAQKIQDYLLSTSPIGQLSPAATFSDEKRKELESQARLEAIKDAKKKAEASAGELDAKIGKVVTVGENEDKGVVTFDGPLLRGSQDAARTSSNASLPVMPGKQKINYSVKVKYELK